MASRASSGDAKTELAQQLTRKLLDQQQIVAVYAQQLALCEPGSAQYKVPLPLLLRKQATSRQRMPTHSTAMRSLLLWSLSSSCRR